MNLHSVLVLLFIMVSSTKGAHNFYYSYIVTIPNINMQSSDIAF